MIKFLYYKTTKSINFDFFPGDERKPFERKKKQLEKEGNTVMEYKDNAELLQLMEGFKNNK